MTQGTVLKGNSADNNDLLREIPTFDISEFHKDPQGFAKKIGDGIKEFGFCGLKNHGIDDKLIAQSFDVMKEYFALPEETKRSYSDPKLGSQRGHIPFGQERAKSAKASDLKEFWHIGRDKPRAGVPLKEKSRLVPNFWPKEVSNFEPTMRALYESLDQLSLTVLRALAIYLGQDQDFFDKRTGHDDSILRALHYPPVTDLTTEAIRAGAHEDINLITLLVGSNEPGLEILDNHGRWIPVTTIPGTIVCNIGDMLQRFTNDVFPSKTHRVINPPGEHRLKARYSIPFFKHLDGDCVIETMDTCISKDRPNKYLPLTEDQYLMQRLIEIDLIPRDRLPEFDLPLHALVEMKANLEEAGKQIPQVLLDEIAKKSK